MTKIIPYSRKALAVNIDDVGLIFKIPGGQLALKRDGTFMVSGTIYSQMISDVFQLLEPPSGGRAWWKIFAINMIYCSSDVEATRVGKENGMNANYLAIARNNSLVAWIQKTEMYKYISVDVFSNIRGYLWNKDTNQPRNDRIAKAIHEYIEANPHSGRDTLLAVARYHNNK